MPSLIDNPLNQSQTEHIVTSKNFGALKNNLKPQDDRSEYQYGRFNKEDHARKLASRLRDILTKPENNNPGSSGSRSGSSGLYDLNTVNKKLNIFVRDKINLPAVQMESMKYSKLMNLNQK